MQFKKNFVFFVMAAVMAATSAAPVSSFLLLYQCFAYVTARQRQVDSGITIARDLVARDPLMRGRSPAPRFVARAPRHGDSGERGDSQDRLAKRRHGDSGERGDSQDRLAKVKKQKCCPFSLD